MIARTEAERLAVELGAPVGDAARVTPMLCAHDETSARILTQPGFTYELKLDGVRIVADKRGERVSLTYRKGRDATDSYPDVALAIGALAEQRVVLDGEIVAFDAGGRPDFLLLSHRIQARARDARRAAQKVSAVYVVFDVLAIGDRDLRDLPIEARRAILERVVPDAGALRLNPSFPRGEELFRACKEHGLEGVVAKRAGSIYRSGERTADWVKVKHELEAEVVVVGWTEGEGKRSRFGSIDVASYENGRLVARGAVGSGLDEEMIDVLLARLRDLEVAAPVAEGRYAARAARRRHVRPELVVNVRYMQLTSDGMLRHSVFRGIRDDVRPEECTLAPRSATSAITMYYRRAAPAMLPWLARRPCIFVGESGPLWPLPKWTPKRVKTTLVRTGGREVRGVIVDDVDVLRFAIDAGATGVLAQPFREGEHGQDFVAWRAPPKGALALRGILEDIGLPAHAKAAGGGAIDVLAPLAPAPPDAAKALATLVARLAGEGVEVLEAVSAPWSVIDGRRVAAPLAWDDLDRDPPSIDDAAPEPLVASKPGVLARAVERLERMVASFVGPKSTR